MSAPSVIIESAQGGYVATMVLPPQAGQVGLTRRILRVVLTMEDIVEIVADVFPHVPRKEQP